jgi:hypothetical protein
MASFAKLDNNNIVLRVESVVNEVLKDSNGSRTRIYWNTIFKNII